MKIAIPLFGTRIAPRFDCADRFLIIEAKEGQVIQQETALIREILSLEKIRRLLSAGIDTFICGGIDGFSERQLLFHGVRVLPWITGEANDALTCFLEGKLESGMMMGSGGRCCGHWRFRGKRGSCSGSSSCCLDSQTRREVKALPNKDGTGPRGQGPGTGQGRGHCGTGQGGQKGGQGQGGKQGQGSGGKQGQGNGPKK